MEDKILYNVFGTTDVSKFKCNENNRDINKKNVEGIKDSFEDSPILYQPLLIDGNYMILDGHHRWMAAKQWNEENEDNLVEVPYIILNGQNSTTVLTTLNSTGRKYTIDDFITLYSKVHPNGQCAILYDKAMELSVTASTLLSIITHGNDVKRYKEYIKKDKNIDGYCNPNSKKWKEVYDFFDFIRSIESYIKLHSKAKQILFLMYESDYFDTNIFIKNVELEYNKSRKQILLPTGQKDCKIELLKLHNKGLQSKDSRFIKYSVDYDGKVRFL